jgi:hypothetical protein
MQEQDIGGYDCPCKFGTKGDGKNEACTTVFPLVAVATLGKELQPLCFGQVY